jgi:hypothetical protein
MYEYGERTMSISIFRATALALASALACAIAVAQQAKPAGPPPKANYSKLSALPDWRGIWTPDFSPAAGAGGEPPLTPEYRAKYDAFRAASAAGRDGGNGRTSNCLPPGMPRIMLQPYNIEFLFTPDRVTIIQEAYMQVRRVFTDGRPLPEDPDPAFNGHSVGRWEGDTLVVETIGIKEDTQLGRVGVSHSDQLKVVERYRLDPKNPDKLTLEFTHTDPKALTQPWKQSFTFTRHREWEQIEFICAENDRNPVGDDGKTQYILRDQ